MTPTSKPAVTPEMVEKARLQWREYCMIAPPEQADLLHFAAEFAASAVQDAVSEMDEFTIHGPDCAMYHAMNPRNKRCTCGLAALRERYGVKP